MTTAGDLEAEIDFLRTELRKPVVMVGMMGAGKTHAGRRLAEKLNLQFFDSDRVVEQRAGIAIPEIFSEYGEDKFRQAERNAILEILSGAVCVLATGGGAVLNDETRKLIKSKAVSVWLDADMETILRRVQNTHTRPLLKAGNPEYVLTELLEKRRPFYAEADVRVDAGGVSPDETVSSVINSLCRYLKTDTV